LLPINQFPEGLPAIGTEIDFTIEGYDPDGVLILNRGGRGRAGSRLVYRGRGNGGRGPS
jgi:hypothetical protein